MAKTLKARVDLVSDSAQLRRDLDKSRQSVKRLSDQIKSSNKSSSFAGVNKSAMLAAGSIGLLYGAYRSGKKAVQATTDLTKGTLALQRVTNLSTKDASRFVAITKVRGIETTKLNTTFIALSKQMASAAAGGKKSAEAFKALGVSQEAIKRGDTKTVLMQAADGLKGMNNAAQRTALAVKLFGKGSAALLPLLLSGSEGIKKQTDLAGKLGAELSGPTLEASKKFLASQREVKLATMGLRIQLGSILMPIIAKVATAVSQLAAAWANGTGKVGEFKATIAGALASFNNVASSITGTRDKIANLSIALGALVAIFAGAKLLGPMAAFANLIPIMFASPVIAIAVGIGAAVIALGVAFKFAYEKSSQFRAVVDRVLAAIRPIIDDVVNTARAQLPQIAATARSVLSQFAAAFERIKPIVVLVMTALAVAVKVAIAAIGPALRVIGFEVGVVSTVLRALYDAGAAVFRGLATEFQIAKLIVTRVAGAIASVFRTLGNTIAAAFNLAKDAVQALLDTIGEITSLPGKVLSVLGLGSSNKKQSDRSTAAAGAGKGATAFGLGGQFRQAASGATLETVSKTRDTRQTAADRASEALRLNNQRIGELGRLKTRTAAQNVELADAKAHHKAIVAASRSANGKLLLAQRDFNKVTAEQARVERINAVAAAKQTLRDYVAGLAEKIKTNFIDKLMAPINARRDAQAAASSRSTISGLRGSIARGQAEARDPRVQTRFLKEQGRLQAKLTQAQMAGNLTLVDSVSSELDTLNARYGPGYVSGLITQLQDAVDAETERTAPAAAEAFATPFVGKLTEALKTFFEGGTLDEFFANIGKALSGSGLTPAAAGGAALGGPGAVEAGGTILQGIGKDLTARQMRIKSIVAGSKSKNLTASFIGDAMTPKLNKQTVWSSWSTIPANQRPGLTVQNRASGGMLSPGALTLVGETGPELIVGGRKVMSATRTNRMGGMGHQITVNAVGAAAADPYLLARQIGWQLATR